MAEPANQSIPPCPNRITFTENKSQVRDPAHAVIKGRYSGNTHRFREANYIINWPICLYLKGAQIRRLYFPTPCRRYLLSRADNGRIHPRFEKSRAIVCEITARFHSNRSRSARTRARQMTRCSGWYASDSSILMRRTWRSSRGRLFKSL